MKARALDVGCCQGPAISCPGCQASKGNSGENVGYVSMDRASQEMGKGRSEGEGEAQGCVLAATTSTLDRKCTSVKVRKCRSAEVHRSLVIGSSMFASYKLPTSLAQTRPPVDVAFARKMQSRIGGLWFSRLTRRTNSHLTSLASDPTHALWRCYFSHRMAHYE